MRASEFAWVLELPARVLQPIHERVAGLLLSPESDFSLASLFCALAIAVLFISLRRQRRARPLRLKVLVRALFPRWLMRNPSMRADVVFFVLNSFVFTMCIAWTVLSVHTVSKATAVFLTGALGPAEATWLPEIATTCLLTLALFLAYELGYWVDHYLSHTVPLLWEFHKVHHTADVLSPLTNYRMHPVDTIVFYNIV